MWGRLTDAISWMREAGSACPCRYDVLGGPLGRCGAGHRPGPTAVLGRCGSVRKSPARRSAVPWFNDHSHYYDMAARRCNNMTKLATGHGDNLAVKGMWPRPGTKDYFHATEVRTPIGTIRYRTSNSGYLSRDPDGTGQEIR